MLLKVKPKGRKTEDEDAKNEASLFEEEVKWDTH